MNSPIIPGMKLPAESWLEFPVRHLESPQVVWTLPDSGFLEEDARAASYVMFSREDAAERFDARQEIAYADRYGGVGVGWCGGSARCGVIGEVQIKGLGRNGLFGSRPGHPLDPWHSTGTLDAVDAAREAIWGSICAHALPFGAVNTLAVVLTGIDLPPLLGWPSISRKRALVFRQPALRPAHFLRNIFFGATPESGNAGLADSRRTCAALAGLKHQLQSFADLGSGSEAHQFSEGLVAIARRQATQVAAAFVKRIFHRGLCCSNIALDGRYIDFGTTTSNDKYSRLAGAPLPAGPDPWNQYEPLLVTLENLRLHILRYCVPRQAGQLIGESNLRQEFLSRFHDSLQNEWLLLTGLPRACIGSMPPALRARAAGVLAEMARSRAGNRYAWRHDDDPAVAHLKSIGDAGGRDLNAVLRDIADFMNTQRNGEFGGAMMKDDRRCDELVSVVLELHAFHLSRTRDDRRVAEARAVQQRMKRVNSPLDFLARSTLDPRLAEASQDGAILGATIQATVRKALTVFTEEATHES